MADANDVAKTPLKAVSRNWGAPLVRWGSKEFRRTSNVVAVLSVAISCYALHASSRSEKLQAQRLEQERVLRTHAELRELFRKRIEARLSVMSDAAGGNPSFSVGAGLTAMDSLLITQAVALAKSIPQQLTAADYIELAIGLSSAGRAGEAVAFVEKAIATAENDVDRVNAKLRLGQIYYTLGTQDIASKQYESLAADLPNTTLPEATRQDYLVQLYLSWCENEWNAGRASQAQLLFAKAKDYAGRLQSPSANLRYSGYLKQLGEMLGKSPPIELAKPLEREPRRP